METVLLMDFCVQENSSDLQKKLYFLINFDPFSHDCLQLYFICICVSYFVCLNNHTHKYFSPVMSRSIVCL